MTWKEYFSFKGGLNYSSISLDLEGKGGEGMKDKSETREVGEKTTCNKTDFSVTLKNFVLESKLWCKVCIHFSMAMEN